MNSNLPSSEARLRHQQTCLALLLWLAVVVVMLVGCGEPTIKAKRRVSKDDYDNWVRAAPKNSIHRIIEKGGADRLKEVRRLINEGADLNEDRFGRTPAMNAVAWGGQFDIALMLLDAGADFKIYQKRQNNKLVHFVLAADRRLPYMTPLQKTQYYQLIKWLEDHGESISQAQADADRWRQWGEYTLEEMSRRHKEEHAQREAREVQQATSATQQQQQQATSATPQTVP